MNKLLKRLSFLLIGFVMVMFSSCNGNDDFPEEGYFTISGRTYSITDASLESMAYTSGLYKVKLSFYNSTKDMELAFFIYSESNQYIPEGKYTPYFDDNEYEDTFEYGVWYIKGEEYRKIYTGEIEVVESGVDNCKIAIEGMDEYSTGVAAKYSGKLEIKYSGDGK